MFYGRIHSPFTDSHSGILICHGARVRKPINGCLIHLISIERINMRLGQALIIIEGNETFISNEFFEEIEKSVEWIECELECYCGYTHFDQSKSQVLVKVKLLNADWHKPNAVGRFIVFQYPMKGTNAFPHWCWHYRWMLFSRIDINK